MSVEYGEYLASPEWKARRDERVRACGARCQVCNSSGSLHVHHRTYERLGNECDSDLTVLCEECHGLFHGKIPSSGAPSPTPTTTAELGTQRVERELLYLMLCEPELSERANRLGIKSDLFTDPLCARTYDQVASMDAEARASIAAMILARDPDLEPGGGEAEFTDAARDFLLRAYRRRLANLDRELEMADGEQRRILLLEMQGLAKKLREDSAA